MIPRHWLSCFVWSLCLVWSQCWVWGSLATAQSSGAKTETTAETPKAAPEPPAEEKETHDALIALRDRILKKHDEKDIAGVLSELDESVVVTMQDGRVCRGPQEVKAYYDEKVAGPDSVVKELKTKCVIERYSRLYNDQETAVVDGRLEQEFFLRDGKQFTLVSPWTASLVKKGTDWKIASFHVSTNMFDNGVLNLFVQQNRLYAGGIAGVAGLVVGVLGGVLFANQKRSNSVPPSTKQK
jgi:hypothetical protein